MNLGSGIVLDIIVVAILLFSTICGMRKGLVMTVVSFMQWFVCVIFGFIFCERVKVYLIDHTALDGHADRIHRPQCREFHRVQRRLSGHA